jgi:hypothetical protein
VGTVMVEIFGRVTDGTMHWVFVVHWSVPDPITVTHCPLLHSLWIVIGDTPMHWKLFEHWSAAKP